MHAAACNEERRCYAIREKLLSGSLEERTQQAAVGWRRLEKQANKEKSILELLFGEGKVAAAVAHLGGVKEIRDRERAPLVLAVDKEIRRDRKQGACEWETVCMCAGSETCES